MEKQIEEMANLLWHFPKAFYLNCYTDCVEVAELLYEENYRKQSEVERLKAEAEHLSAENKRLQNLLNDLMKDEETS